MTAGHGRHQRFSIAPLLALAGPDATDETFAGSVGVHRSVPYRWRRDGIPFWAADRAAIAIGSHPLLIWPDFHSLTDFTQLKDIA